MPQFPPSSLCLGLAVGYLILCNVFSKFLAKMLGKQKTTRHTCLMEHLKQRRKFKTASGFWKWRLSNSDSESKFPPFFLPITEEYVTQKAQESKPPHLEYTG